MTYATLTAAKGSAGSIANWVGYGKIDIATVLDEAQSIIFQSLRVREMRTEWLFGMAVGQSQIALPDRYLDPMGRLFDLSHNIDYGHSLEADILKTRSYEPPVSGVFPANPIFLPSSGGTTVGIFLAGVNLGQGSIITLSGATPIGVNSINVNGTWPVVRFDDANSIVIDALQSFPASPSGVYGGGSAVAYTYVRLTSGPPSRWSIWDELLKFDSVFDTQTFFKQLYYRAPPLLSASNPTNFLTTRYPRLIREATNAAAASFMKDDNEEQKALTKLAALIDATNAESDLLYRGVDTRTITP